MQAQKCKKGYFFAKMKKGQPKRTDDRLMRLTLERMKELRAERGFSQEYVVERTKLNLSQYEAGINSPSLDSLSILCKFYGITLAEFFDPLNYPPKE